MMKSTRCLIGRLATRMLVAITVFLLSGAVIAKDLVVPNSRDIAGHWIGFDCGGRVWRMHLNDDGSGVVAYGTSGGVSANSIATLILRKKRIEIELEDTGFGVERLVGTAYVRRLELKRMPARCTVRFQREERVVRELQATGRQLADHRAKGP